MAQVKVHYSPDYQNLGQLKGARKYNLDTAAREALGLVLGAGNEGVFVWDTEEKVGYTWSGDEWISEGSGAGDAYLSRYFIPPDVELTVPENHNFLLVQELDIEGLLEIDGRLEEIT